MRFFLLACLLMTFIFSADSAAPGPPKPYQAQWKKIDALLAKSQTTTAAPLVEAIYQQARKEQDAPAYVRALLYKVRLQQAKEEDDTEKSIALLEQELRTAHFPARPILHSLLAELYTSYLNQNRYRLYQRTAGAGATAGPTAGADGGTSLATWDVGKLGAAIVRHYYQSVEDAPERQLATSLAALGDLAFGGDAEGRALRPTLYDLLAQRAIEGLKNQELYVTQPEQQFQLVDPQLFGSAAEFAALRLLAPAADSLNGQVHALHLLQRLTASRQQLAPANRAALADVDLSRLDYLRSLTQGTSLAEQYEPALVRLAEAYRALPISTEFLARRAELRRETDAGAAVQLAREAELRFPKSRGAARARALREEIERPELSFSAAEVVIPNQPWRLDLTTRNVTKLHAWAYRISLKEWQQFREYDSRRRPFAERYARPLRTAPTATWPVAVPSPPRNYETQKLSTAGAALPVGYYLLVVSNQATKPTNPRPGAVTSYALLGASELSAVSQHEPTTGALRLLVLHRQRGEPLAGVRVRASYRGYQPTARKYTTRQSEALQTDAAGTVTLPLPSTEPGRTEQLLSAQVGRGPDTLQVTGLDGYYQPSFDPQSSPRRQTFLFTDRAIYRPGQTLYFKGILTENQSEKSSLVANQRVSVQLVDVNGQTAQTLPFITSEFGSFHGSVVLPTGLLNGQMTLQTDHGSISFGVEDYKRPTFLVKLDSVPGRPQLGQPLTVTGHARAYAGQATDGATVSYRVTRRELFALFDYGGYERGGYAPGRGGRSQEIAHGNTLTDAEGRFSIVFTPPLVPKVASRRPGEPGYLFEITADVTDAAGETRTATRSVPIGRNPLSLRLTGPNQVDKQHLPAFTLLSTNATGEPLSATGTLRLLARRYRPNPPGVPGPVPENEDNEAAAELVSTRPFNTEKGAMLDLKPALATLPTGRYRLEAVAVGADSARARLEFTLYDSGATTMPFGTPDWFVSLADTVAPGQPATILLGSSEANARVLLEVERQGKLLRREWLTLNANEQRRLAVESGTAAAGGPLHIHTTQVRDNRLYRHDATVAVAEQPQPLRITISTFRNRLQPGQSETWRVTIRQANSKAAAAELLATLYDQSLDVFRPHGFAGLEVVPEYYPVRFGWQGEFEELNSQPSFEIEISNGLMVVQYPRLNEWGVDGIEVAEQEALKGRVSGVRVRANKIQAMGSAATVRFTSPVIKKDEEMRSSAPAAPGSAQAMSDDDAPDTITLAERMKQASQQPDLATISARTDFRETAFWQPALHTDQNGDVVLKFQMPEAVTRWQLLALAHDKNLHSGQLARQYVTQKQIQITPNAPRFFRQGDTFTFPAKFSNLTDYATRGTAQLFLLDAATGQDITSQLLKGPAQQVVSAGAHQSIALGWEVKLPTDFAPAAVTYRVVASSSPSVGEEQVVKGKKAKKGKKELTTNYTDGEENTLPVLPNRLLITDSLPLPLVGPGPSTFELQKLTSTSSPTRRNYGLTLEMTANPAWYAVQSLPYLMDYPYECSEQVF
ncbi:MAG TPA: MG2 domain-containing protein, partial [Hymenobacter sp.]